MVGGFFIGMMRKAKIAQRLHFLLIIAVVVIGLHISLISASSWTVDVCKDATRIVKYDVAVIDVNIPINGWGDFNPQGMMYALNNKEAIPNVAHIRDPNFQLYNSTDESLPEKIQPLFLRANQGDCIIINVTNELKQSFEDIDPVTYNPINPKDNRRNVGMHISGLPFDPLTSDGAFVGRNPDSTIPPGQSRQFKWYAHKVGGYLFRDNSNVMFPQDTIVKGLFGMVIVEPKDSVWTDPVTGRHLLKANPQFGNSLSDIAPIDVDGEGRDVVLGVGASMFADVIQLAGAELPKGTLTSENIVGRDYRSFAFILHDEFEGTKGPVVWNENGSIAAFGQPFDPNTGVDAGTFLMNYRSEPLRNRINAVHRHRGMIAMPEVFDENGIKVSGGLINGLEPNPFTNPGLGVPFVDVPMPDGSTLTINAANMTVVLTNGRTILPSDEFCDDGVEEVNNAKPGDINYTFYKCVGEEIHLSSWPFGDQATPIPRAYWGDPIVMYASNPISHDTHSFHVHPPHRWLQEPDQVDDDNLPLPANPTQKTTRLDSQGITAGEVYRFVFEGGAGGNTGSAGDSIFHCHLYPHFADGMWSAFRVFDKLRISFANPNGIQATLENGTGIFYPDGTQTSVLRPLPSRLELFNTTDPFALDNRGPIPSGINNRVPTIPTPNQPGYPNFVAGRVGFKALQPPKFIVDPITHLPIKDRATPTQMETLASYDGIVPGSVLVDPCAGPQHEFGIPGRKPDRIYEPTAVQVPFIQNKKGGFYNPETRAYVERELVNDVVQDPSLLNPYSIRANQGDCIVTYLTNGLQPDDNTTTLGINDGIFNGPTNTPEASLHIHMVRYDILGTDGTAVGWNYDQSARSQETIAYRWFADVNSRTSFFHDHQFANSHQRNGLYGVLNIEPFDAKYRDPETGNPLGPLISGTTYGQSSGKYAQAEMKGVGPAADIVASVCADPVTCSVSGGKGGSFREFVIQYGDFIPSFRTDREKLAQAFEDYKSGDLSTIFSEDFRKEPVVPPLNPSDLDADQGISTINYRAEPFQARINQSGATEHQKNPAYIYSSVIHGDPETEVFRAYPGDPVVIRNMADAHEESHSFELHGHKWLDQPSNDLSFLTDSKGSIIAEYFNYEPQGNLLLNDFVHGSASIPQAAGLPGDYLFASTAMLEKWEGVWGIFRVENGLKSDLKPLPGRPAPSEIGDLFLLDQVVDSSQPVPKVNDTMTQNANPCPSDAPTRHFNVVAIQNEIMYNDRYGEYDPFGLLFVLDEDKEKIENGEKEIEPLILRANQGDCIEIILQNDLPDLFKLANKTSIKLPNGTLSKTSIDPNTDQHFGDAQMSAIMIGLPLNGTQIGDPEPEKQFLFHEWPMGDRVSLHPHLLNTVPSVGIGATIGFMRDQTIGRGENITYRWYADSEVGLALLDSYGDERSHRHHGLFAAIVIEEKNNTYVDPKDPYVSTDPSLGEELRTGAQAVLYDKINKNKTREFVALYMDGLNLRNDNNQLILDIPGNPQFEIEHMPCSPEKLKCEDIESQGEAGINYRTERLENKVPFKFEIIGGEQHLPENLFNKNQFKAFSSSVFGDPKTPIFEAFAGDPTVFRVGRPADVVMMRSLALSGHSWLHEPNDPDSSEKNTLGSFGVGKAHSYYLLGGAGGYFEAPGDYLYHDFAHIDGGSLPGGMWGIFRVHDKNAKADIEPLNCTDKDDDEVCDMHDRCDGTQEGEDVDQNGCTLEEFCSSVAICGPGCDLADFKNDEPGQNPMDCVTAIIHEEGTIRPICTVAVCLA